MWISTSTTFARTLSRDVSLKLFWTTGMVIDGNNFDFSQGESCLRTSISLHVALREHSVHLASVLEKLIASIKDESLLLAQVQTLTLLQSMSNLQQDSLMVGHSRLRSKIRFYVHLDNETMYYWCHSRALSRLDVWFSSGLWSSLGHILVLHYRTSIDEDKPDRWNKVHHCLTSHEHESNMRQLILDLRKILRLDLINVWQSSLSRFVFLSVIGRVSLQRTVAEAEFVRPYVCVDTGASTEGFSNKCQWRKNGKSSDQ